MGSGAGGLYKWEDGPGDGSEPAAGGTAPSSAASPGGKPAGAASSIAEAAEGAGPRARTASGRVGSSRGIRLKPDEYAMVVSELNGMYHARLEGKSREYVSIGDCTYKVMIHGFDDYTITGKRRIE